MMPKNMMKDFAHVTVTQRLAIFSSCAVLALAAPALFAPAAAAAETARAAKAAPGSRIGIAVLVNDDVITFSDIENRMRLYMLGAPPNLPEEARQKLLQQTIYRLVDEKLQLQEAKSLNISVTDQEITDGFDMLAAKNKATPEQFRDGLTQAGINLGTMRDQIRAELAWTQVVRRRLRPQIVISETEINTELERLQRSAGRTEYRIAEIFLSFGGPASEKDAYDRIEALAAEVRSGRPFSQLARQFSEAPGAATGGDLGWIEQGTLAADLENAIVGLEPGQLSAPVRTDKGYHLLFLRDVRTKGQPANAAPAPTPAAPVAPAAATPAQAASQTLPAAPMVAYATVKRITLPLQPQETEDSIQAKIARAAQLRGEITTCAGMDARMKDFGTPNTGDMGRLPLGDLPADAQSALAPLEEGQLSAPVRSADGVSVYMACGKDMQPAPASSASAAEEQPVPAAETAQEAAEKAAEATAEKSPAAEEKPAAPPAPAATTSAADTPASAAQDSAAEAQREEIANRLGSQRLEQMAERYLRDLRATAFIEQRF